MADLIARRFVPLVAASLAIGIIVLALGYLGAGEGESGDAGGFVVIVLITLIIGFLVWRYVVQPRATAGAGSARAALILGILSLVPGMLYWLGIAFVLAPAAVALGTLARERDRVTGVAAGDPAVAGDAASETSVRVQSRAQEATIAVVLGWAGLLLATVFGLADSL